MMKKIYRAQDSEQIRTSMHMAVKDLRDAGEEEEADATKIIADSWTSEVQYAEAKGFLSCATIVAVGYMFAKLLK